MNKAVVVNVAMPRFSPLGPSSTCSQATVHDGLTTTYERDDDERTAAPAAKQSKVKGERQGHEHEG